MVHVCRSQTTIQQSHYVVETSIYKSPSNDKKIDTVKSAMQCQNIKKNEHWDTCFIFRSVQSTESVLDFFLVLKICHVHDYWLYLVLLTNVKSRIHKPKGKVFYLAHTENTGVRVYTLIKCVFFVVIYES